MNVEEAIKLLQRFPPNSSLVIVGEHIEDLRVFAPTDPHANDSLWHYYKLDEEFLPSRWGIEGNFDR